MKPQIVICVWSSAFYSIWGCRIHWPKLPAALNRTLDCRMMATPFHMWGSRISVMYCQLLCIMQRSAEVHHHHQLCSFIWEAGCRIRLMCDPCIVSFRSAELLHYMCKATECHWHHLSFSVGYDSTEYPWHISRIVFSDSAECLLHISCGRSYSAECL